MINQFGSRVLPAYQELRDEPAIPEQRIAPQPQPEPKWALRVRLWLIVSLATIVWVVIVAIIFILK